jgi:succinyl-CoA synthetase beta subunit
MKTEKKHTRFNIYKPMQCKHSKYITRYIAYQLQIKGNEVKKITQISELTYQIYMDSENYLVNLHQFPLPDASIKLLK